MIIMSFQEMIVLLVGLLLVLGTTANGELQVRFNETEREIHMDDVAYIPFILEGLGSNIAKVNLTAISSDSNIVQVSASGFDPGLVHDGSYKGVINATGVFLGKVEVFVSANIDGVRIFTFFLIIIFCEVHK